MAKKTLTLIRAHVYGTRGSYTISAEYRGRFFRDWVCMSQSATLDAIRAYAKAFGFTHVQWLGNWAHFTQPKNGKV